jgi:hypothetical protein
MRKKPATTGQLHREYGWVHFCILHCAGCIIDPFQTKSLFYESKRANEHYSVETVRGEGIRTVEKPRRFKIRSKPVCFPSVEKRVCNPFVQKNTG